MAVKTNGTATKANTTTKTNTASKVEEGIEVIDGHIVITMRLAKTPKPSASGKTFTLASTGGFTWLEDLDVPGFESVGVSVNVNGKK